MLMFDCQDTSGNLVIPVGNPTHAKRQILTYFFCEVISLLAQVFIVSVDRAYKEMSTKKY